MSRRYLQDSRNDPQRSRRCDARVRTALDDPERELAVLTAIVNALVTWDSFDLGSQRLVRELASALGQRAGALLVPQGDYLVTQAKWSMAHADTEALQRALAVRIARGTGLAGSAWERGEVIDRTPPSSGEGAARSTDSWPGLRATIAMPCAKGKAVFGVIELYSTARAEFSSYLLRVLAYAGRALGEFFAGRYGELSVSPPGPRELDVLDRLALELDLAEALDRDQLFVGYQPAVLEKACRQAASWSDEGHELGVAVSVPGPHVESDSFMEEVQHALTSSGLRPDLLTLEVTGSALIRDALASAERLRMLKQLGVLIAIDRFGNS